MKKRTILVLDEVGRTLSTTHELKGRLLKAGIDCDILWEYQIGNHDSYEAPDIMLQNLEKLSEGSSIDAIVIGNNMGAGLKKAAVVSDVIKSRTIIVWTEPDPMTRKHYERLGFTKFSSHLKLADDFLKLINLEEE